MADDDDLESGYEDLEELEKKTERKRERKKILFWWLISREVKSRSEVERE